jgi:hypothetical protein
MSNLPQTKDAIGAAAQQLTSAFFKQIKANGLALVQPHLVAIYLQETEPKAKTQQVGTGFLVRYKNRPVLITAKHTLYGKRGDENPGEKAIVVPGGLKLIGHLQSRELVQENTYDIAAMYVDEFDLARCLPLSSLTPVDVPPNSVTIYGYLARDFNLDRAEDALKPAPWIYTNSRTDHGRGYIALLYPKHQNRSTDSGLTVMAPIPQGLSGCPMLDGEKLFNGEVRVIGVFTECPEDQGTAVGTSSTMIIALLDGL